MLKKLLFLLSLLFLFSCSQESEDFQEVPPDLGKATFSFSELNSENDSSLGAKKLNNFEPYAIVLSVTNSSNEIVFDNREFIFLKSGSEFITESIDLNVGDYEITSFNVINSDNEVIYASPLEGSEKAQLISIPLPISFSIFSNQTTVVVPEVILIEDVAVVETQNFFVSAKEVVSGIVNDVEATFMLTVQNSDYTLTGNIGEGANPLIIPEILDETIEISLTVIYNSESKTQVITNDQLKDYVEMSPLTFYFQSGNAIEPLETPVPSFTFTSNEDYSVKTFVNTTLNTAFVEWTLPNGAAFVNGTSETDEIIDIMFPTSGNYTISLEVTSQGLNEAGELVSLIGSSSVIVPIVNSINEIVTPIIIGGGFERPAEIDLTKEGRDRVNNDLGKEYWIADGVSTRVWMPRDESDVVDAGGNFIDGEVFAAYPGETVDNERIWFRNFLFNRIGVTSSARTGEIAASWNAGEVDPRVIVQYIEVIPGVDYKVSFFYSNDLNSTDVSLQCLILDPSVVEEADISSETIIAQGLYNEQTNGSYTEGSLSFTVNSSDQKAVKLYFNTTDVTGDYRLDDISIAID